MNFELWTLKFEICIEMSENWIERMLMVKEKRKKQKKNIENLGNHIQF